MNKTFTLFTVLLVLPLSLLAQANYKKAQVVLTNEDTLQGFVNLREWNRNPDSFQFKSDISDEESQMLTPDNVQYVTIENTDTYHRYIGPISMNYLEVQKIPVGADFKAQTDSVFLRQIIAGEYVALFSYTDKIKTRYFVRNQTTGLTQELYFAKYLAYPQARQIQFVRQYKGQLWGIANALDRTTKHLRDQIEKADYKEEELIAIVRGMNGTGETVAAVEAKARRKANYFAGLGVYRSSALAIEKGSSTSDTDRSVSYGPFVTFGLLSYFNQNTKRLAVRLEAGLTEANHVTYATLRKEGMKSYTVQKFEQDYYNISLAPQLQYNVYNNQGWQVLVSGGLSINYAIANKSLLTSQNHYFNDAWEEVTGPSYTSELPFNNLWYAVPFKIGARWSNKYEITAGYNATIKPGINEGIKSNALQLIVSYHFGS